MLMKWYEAETKMVLHAAGLDDSLQATSTTSDVRTNAVCSHALINSLALWLTWRTWLRPWCTSSPNEPLGSHVLFTVAADPTASARIQLPCIDTRGARKASTVFFRGPTRRRKREKRTSHIVE